MKPFRVLFMLTTLLATASTIHAQFPSAASVKVLHEAAQEAQSTGGRLVECPLELIELAQALRAAGNIEHSKFSVGPFTIELKVTQTRSQPVLVVPAPECPDVNTPSWFTQAIQESTATWRRLRAMCSTGKQDSACCEAACGLSLVVKAAQCEKSACGAGAVKSGQTAQATKACACAKACACCESCKERKATASPRIQFAPYTVNNDNGFSTWTCPLFMSNDTMPVPPLAAFPPFACPAVGAQSCLPPMVGTGVMQVTTIAPQTRPAHLVTPDLDAHCERMTHRGDLIVLEGNVLLLCKKHAQPVRIEAHRVLVNMKDGSFTVESSVRPVTTTSFGVQRTSSSQSAPICIDLEFATSPPAATPSQGIIRVVPVPTRGLVVPTSRPR